MTYDEAICNMRECVWSTLGDQLIKETLQTIVDHHLRLVNESDRYLVEIVDFTDSARGKCFPWLQLIEMRSDLVNDGVIHNVNGALAKYKHPLNNLFFYLMHEVEHANQHIESRLPVDDNDYNRKVVNCNLLAFDGRPRSHISNSSKMATNKAVLLPYIYNLQPAERFAWEYANNATKEFIKTMHEKFPLDKAFSDEFKYFNLEDHVVLAKEFLRTRDPIKSIDDILLTMNGNFVEDPLHDLIRDIITETQETQMRDRIEMQEAKNIKIIEEQIAEREKKIAENALDIDEFWDIKI